MRLKVHAAAAADELVALVNEGYEALEAMQAAYAGAKDAGTYRDETDAPKMAEPVQTWANKVQAALIRIFPTALEANLFGDPEIPFGAVSGDYQYASTAMRCRHLVRGLNKIRVESVAQYTDMPLDTRIYVEDIDSFRKVRDVNPAMVMDVLKNGYLDRPEDAIQTAIERILSVSFHKEDWGGEQNDLYTANVIVSGQRRESAFMLKGSGLRKATMEIKDCGKNGDQLLRLFNSPAKLYMVQFVGTISEAVIADVDGKVRQARVQGRDVCYSSWMARTQPGFSAPMERSDRAQQLGTQVPPIPLPQSMSADLARRPKPALPLSANTSYSRRPSFEMPVANPKSATPPEPLARAHGRRQLGLFISREEAYFRHSRLLK